MLSMEDKLSTKKSPPDADVASDADADADADDANDSCCCIMLNLCLLMEIGSLMPKKAERKVEVAHGQ